MYVRYGFTIEIYRFMHTLRTFGTCRSGCHRTMAWRSRSRTRKLEDGDRTSPDVWKTVNCSTKGWKTDNDDKKQLARHHSSNLLRSLTREQIGKESTASSCQRFELCHFDLSMCSAWGIWCACVYLVNIDTDRKSWLPVWQLPVYFTGSAIVTSFKTTAKLGKA